MWLIEPTKCTLCYKELKHSWWEIFLGMKDFHNPKKNPECFKEYMARMNKIDQERRW